MWNFYHWNRGSQFFGIWWCGNFGPLFQRKWQPLIIGGFFISPSFIFVTNIFCFLYILSASGDLKRWWLIHDFIIDYKQNDHGEWVHVGKAKFDFDFSMLTTCPLKMLHFDPNLISMGLLVAKIWEIVEVLKFFDVNVLSRVWTRLKILYSNFLFIHYEAEVGICFYIAKTAIQAEICVAKCLKCGAFCSAIQSNSHPGLVHLKYYIWIQIPSQWDFWLQRYKQFLKFLNSTNH